MLDMTLLENAFTVCYSPALFRYDHLGVERMESMPQIEVIQVALEWGQPRIRRDSGLIVASRRLSRRGALVAARSPVRSLSDGRRR